MNKPLIGALVMSAGMSLSAPAQSQDPQEALAALSRVAPTIAEVIRGDAALRAEVGAEKLAPALRQLARFAESRDPDCREALRIMGDAVPRLKPWVGKVSPDGDPSEWDAAIPPPEFGRHASGKSHDLWERGAAAVVHDDSLYIMAGLPPEYFKDPANELRITVDCQDGPEWDVRSSVTRREGRWSGGWQRLGEQGGAEKALSRISGAVGAVAEVAIRIGDVVPAAKAKPIWTLWLEARQGDQWRSARYLPVVNDAARAGVAAGPYVAAFLLLCGDATVAESDRTAAAIAIMSATFYQCGDTDVRKQIRRDNADFLRFARDLDAWQQKTGTEYRLKDYPLEAQLAWAHRCLLNTRFFIHGRDPKRSPNSAENYYWTSTSVDTLRKLRTVAVAEGLVSPSVCETAEKMDRWVRKKQTYSLSPEWYRRHIEDAEDDPDQLAKLQDGLETAELRKMGADVVGQYRGKPVSEFRISHSEILLGQIQRHGRTLGTCGNHTFLCRDLLRSVGIAEISFLVEPSRSDKIDHVWPAHYDPGRRLWHSYQAGRKDMEWWYFSVQRIPVYAYAATAPHLFLTKAYQGPRPFPFLFSREVQGRQVKEQAQKGFETEKVREWMLTPCF